MADQYEVLTEALREHAKKVDQVSDRLAQAVDAAREMNLPTDAYGTYCQVLPMMLNPLQHLATTALDSSLKRLSSAAANVRATAVDYADIDDANAMTLYRTKGTE
ncbi:MAG: ESX-1 secretion-associated protein [Actinomycetota bacterium]|nr:ESX-1 secretion-associated protein [Actinomycetota bacterium]